MVFVSKSLRKSQLRWSVIQKEAYGIFYSCMYLQSLLRDRLFTIRTDHQNLLFIKEASNPMIVRWYMAFSELSFNLSFIRGVCQCKISLPTQVYMLVYEYLGYRR